MIKIYPTTASGLSHATYAVSVRPRNTMPNLKKERPQAVNITLSGETVVTTWQKKLSGTIFQVDGSATPAEYEKLKLIDEHATVFTWVIMLQGRTFTASVDVISATPSSIENWNITVKFTIISELNK